MTELEFISTDPSLYGNNHHNINLLVSSSLITSGTVKVPSGSIYLQGMTIPFVSKESVSIETALREVTSVRFKLAGYNIKAPIIARQHKNNYYFFRTQSTYLPALPSGYEIVGDQRIYSASNAELILIPYISTPYQNSDYNPLISTTQVSVRSPIRQVVDRAANQIEPTNLLAILSQSATPAEVQESDYTKASVINGRYVGSVLDNEGISGDDPALNIRSFVGSVYPEGADVTTLVNSTNVVTKNIYFNIVRIPSKQIPPGASYVSDISFPSTTGSLRIISASYTNGSLDTNTTYTLEGNLLYEEQDKKFVRIVSSKVLATEKGTVFTTDEFGRVILDQTSSI